MPPQLADATVPPPAAAQPATTPPDASRVIRAARAGWDSLAVDRAIYQRNVEFYEGRHRATNEGGGLRRPTNLISQMVEAYHAALLGSGQETKLKPKLAGNRGLTLIREKRLKVLEKKIGFEAVHEAAVTQALLGGMGIYYCGLRGSDTMIQVDGELYDPGEPFAVSVDLGDFTIDPLARSIEEATFMGHRFRFNVQLAIEMEIGNIELLKSIPDVSSTTNKNPVGAAAYGSAGRDTIIDLAEAWNIVFWDGRKTWQGVVIELSGGTHWLIDPIEYKGPERGPYEIVRFINRINRATGISPAERIRDLHTACEEVSAAIVRQVVDTDRKLVVESGQKELADDLTNKALRIVVGDPRAAEEKTVGGLAKEMLPGWELLKMLAYDEGINLQQAMGTNTGGDSTATEASIVAGKAATLLKRRKGKANTARANVSKRLSAWLDDDMVSKQTFSHRLAGGETVELLWDPAANAHRFDDFEYEVQVTDIDVNDPNMEKVRVLEMFQTLSQVVPAIQMSMGDPQAVVRIVSDKFAMPELDEVWPNQGGMMMNQAMGAMYPPAQPAGMQPGPSKGQNPIQPQNQRASDYSRETRM